MSERGALLTAGGAVPGAGVPAGAQIMTFMGMKEMQKKKKQQQQNTCHSTQIHIVSIYDNEVSTT